MIFEKIKQQIMADPMNAGFTARGTAPLFLASAQARIVIVGQAPGRKAEEAQRVWNDPSGDRLRQWLGMTDETFYKSEHIAHMPMDFYYPGKAKNGDAPPRKGFAEKWHPQLLAAMPQAKLILLIGGYAQQYYLKNQREHSLTETVRNYKKYLPHYFPLVHPSPLNLGWLKQNPWFEKEVLPVLRELVRELF